MKKRMIVCGMTMLLLLSGCKLAKEGGSAAEVHDCMIGVMITEEHLDLFDFERYVQDNASTFLGGGNVVVEDTTGYENRIYANMENQSCVFEEVEGILFASYAYETETEKGSRMTPNEGISDGHVYLNEGEDGTSFEMEGTIYVDDRAGEYCFFYNPVYQDVQGRVYLTSGTGSSGNILEGSSMKTMHTLSEEFEMTEGNQTQTYEADIKITVAAIRLAEKYVLVSMDANHQEVFREEYAPEELPGEVRPAEGADYLLVEAHSTTTEGEAYVTRTIHSRDDENKSLDVFTPLENGICVKGTTQIRWPADL